MANNVNVRSRLLDLLASNNDVTPKQIRKKLNITNVAARVSELRRQGYAIYLNERTSGNGRTVQAYRLGQPRSENIPGTLHQFGGRSW